MPTSSDPTQGERESAVVRFTRHPPGRPLELEVRPRGRGAGAPFALVGDGIEIELTAADLEWLCAVSPRALQAGADSAMRVREAAGGGT